MAWTAPRTWVTGETVTAALLNAHLKDNMLAAHPDGVTPNNWTPTLEAQTTDPVGLNVTGEEFEVGGLHFCWARWTFDAGSESAGSGTYFVTLPQASSGITAGNLIGNGQAIGSWVGRDNSAVAGSAGTVMLRATSEAAFQQGDTATAGRVDHDDPWAWTTNDILSFYAVYPTA